MQEVISQILAHVRGAWRYHWYMLLLAWPLCVGGWIYVESLPDQYEATARVYLDTESILRPLLKGLTVDLNIDNEIAMMTRTLLSRPNLEKVARMTDMDLKARTPQQMDTVIDDLSAAIKFEQTRGENLFQISYENNDPQLAKRVVQSLLTIFMESTMGDKRKDTDEAGKFLDEQIKEYEARLAAAEDKLRDFKREHVGTMPEEGHDYYQSLQEAIGALEQAQVQLQEAENRQSELQRQIQDDDQPLAFTTATPMPANVPPDPRIENLQIKLDDMLLRYTDQHPDVIALKRTIAELKKEQVAPKSAASASTGSNDINPYQAQLKLSLSSAEADVASLKARVAAFQHKVEDLKRMVNIIPEVETQLVQLNRDYEVNKSDYETLLARRQSASISEQLDQDTDAVKFRVLDPPYVPVKPSGPQRPLLTSGALLAGTLLGVIFAVFLSEINPTFDGRRSLMQLTGLPVLGGVSMIWTRGGRRRKRLELSVFGLLATVLLMVYGGFLTMQLLDIHPLTMLRTLV